MPRKIRELKTQITREGFVYLPKRGKGSHERWRHPLLQKTLTISGEDGDDVPLYLKKQLEQLLAVFNEVRTWTFLWGRGAPPQKCPCPNQINYGYIS